MIALSPKPAAVLMLEQHKEKTHEWWTLPEVREAFEAYIQKNQFCKICGGPARVPHHNDRGDYKNLKRYLSALETSRVFAVCHDCHGKIHHGYQLCPTCGTRLMKPGYEQCYACKKVDATIGRNDSVLRTVICPHCLKPQESTALGRVKCQYSNCRVSFNHSRHEARLR